MATTHSRRSKAGLFARRAVFAGALASIASFSGHASAQIVQDGSFGTTGSTGNLTTDAPANWTYVAGNGTGCLVVADSFTGCGFSPTNPGNSPNGGNFIAIDTSTSAAAGTIEQTIGSLTVGTRYTLSFYAGQEGTGPIIWTVALGGTTLAIVSDSTAGWEAAPIAVTFTATSAESAGLLTFAASTSGTAPIAFLDSVSIPEPAPMSVLAVGAIGLAGMRRRRARPEA